MAPASYSSAAPLDAARVLVVDDEHVSLQFVRLHLARSEEVEVAVCTAGSVDEARKQLEAPNDIALVLLDWEMPGTPGIELLRWMRADAAARSVPVIMMTARGTQRDVLEALEAGTNDYLVKPIRRQALLEKLKKHLPPST